MTAEEFFQTKLRKAKGFGFPEPIYLNAEKLTNRSRVLLTVEIQATHIPDRKKGKTHHYALKFSKFKKIKEEPYWIEDTKIYKDGFTISAKSSIEKLAAYIKANHYLLKIDMLSKDFTSAVLTNDSTTQDVLEQILSSNRNKKIIFELFRDHYPELDERILTYKLIEKRKLALDEFAESLNDPNKKERNYWQPFLEKQRWMFGLSYLMPLEEKRIDIQTSTDYLFKSIEGFVDIIEIKHPHYNFWAKDSNGNYKYYREYLLISNELNGAITQASNYIFQLEKKFSDVDWQRKNQCDPPVKPNCIVILGRSNDWTIEEKTAFRLLNDSLHGINVLTFDHLYNRANKLLSLLKDQEHIV